MSSEGLKREISNEDPYNREHAIALLLRIAIAIASQQCARVPSRLDEKGRILETRKMTRKRARKRGRGSREADFFAGN